MNTLIIVLISALGLMFLSTTAPGGEGSAPAQVPTSASVSTQASSRTRYAYDLKRHEIKMRDGVSIAISLFIPRAKHIGERFPVLLEMQPYRKDDLFFARDWSLNHYFAERGFIMARADVRGTGSSSGPVPKVEYSEEELGDAEELIAWLAKISEGNGRVGMWGFSWSGFNALQVAMRRPPALKAVLALHASDDLYKDDIHYVDGIFHMDEYMLDMDHEVALPKPPEYRLDREYVRDRFESYPWILSYLHQQLDGDFWRKKSLRFQPERIAVPVFLVGGLLDSYRDTVPRLLASLRVPVRALMGPYIHDWPDNGTPGPNYEWRAEAVEWWNQYLRDSVPMTPFADKRFTVFVRDSHAPSTELQSLPGQWCEMKEFKSRERTTLHLGGDHGLHLKSTESVTASSTMAPGDHRALAFRYDPGAGTALGFYWGELTGDMKDETSGSLVFETEPLREDLVLAGIARLKFVAEVDRPLVHFVVRLEDHRPDGGINHVTGAALNGSQRHDRLTPKPLTPGQREPIEMDLHFSTWTFRKGHRIRLVFAGGAFPMLWSTPELTRTKIFPSESRLELPLLSSEERASCHDGPAGTIEPRPVVSGFWEDSNIPEWPARERVFSEGSRKFFEAHGGYSIKLNGWQITMREFARHGVNTIRPADASYSGWVEHDFASDKRSFYIRTEIDIRSDKKDFHVEVRRTLKAPGEPERRKSWRERIRRIYQ